MVEIFEVFPVIGVVALVLGAFFAIRGVYRFKEWQAGEKDELWTFLSMILGCVSLVILGIVAISFSDPKGVPEAAAIGLVSASLVGFLLGLGAIGLTTVYYIQKWRSAT